MIKAVLFDMDGVLIDADKWHFNALNVALQHSDIDPISWQEHLTIYKGIPTRRKLEILTERRGLPRELWHAVHQSKQDTTIDIINRFCRPDEEKVEMMKLLRRRYQIAVCSNAMRETVRLMLGKSGLLDLVDFYLSNEDVAKPKPDPEIYSAAIARIGCRADECVIVEDSDVGKKAAKDSGAVLCSVDGPHEVNYYRVLNTVQEAERINVVIPAAGQGKRFSEVGYVYPKPLVDVQGKPMIQLVLDNFANVGSPIVIMQKKHVDQYCIEGIIRHRSPGARVVTIDSLTEGSACTILQARELINTQAELIIGNSDQYVDIDIMQFIGKMREIGADGGILTFRDSHPKWSYAKIDDSGRVIEVAEKKPISEHATVGIYYFRHGSDFVKYAARMIQKDIRVNNEFYTCPIYNELIADGKDVRIFEIPKSCMHGLGTPEDLTQFLLRAGETKIFEVDGDLTRLPLGSVGATAPAAEEDNSLRLGH